MQNVKHLSKLVTQNLHIGAFVKGHHEVKDLSEHLGTFKRIMSMSYKRVYLIIVIVLLVSVFVVVKC